ncbi:MAG: TonB-dependent receptor [Oligoflexus sp.]
MLRIRSLWHVTVRFTIVTALFGIPKPLFAQFTTSILRGSVLDSSGNPVENAEVKLEHQPSQTQKNSVTNSMGEFAFTGLRVGGPYKLSIQHDSAGSSEREELYLKAGNNDPMTIRLQKAEVMQVVANRSVPVSHKRMFGEEDIRNAPTTTGDLKDVIRNSADVYTDGQALSIGGTNSRFNSVTIDGIRQDDDFGLNNNGYPTQRSPISLEAVSEISVERSPFDVRYSNFLGGNVNVVTKSGGNEFEGSISSSYSSEALVGSKSKDRDYTADFEEARLGLTLGGPIVRDRLHFFLSVEGLQGRTPNLAGPAGSGQPIEASRVTAEEVARAQEISQSVYGFNAGTPGQSLTEDDLKFLAKIDWTIDDKHRLEAKYQQSSGNNIVSTTANESTLPLTSNWYNRRDTLDTLSLRLFSDWTYNFSTKVEVSKKKVVNEQEPLEGNGFMAAEIETADGGSILLGPDRFRHANEMDNESTFINFESNYLLADHHITSGIDYSRVDIFNLFVPSSNGVAVYSSLDDFAARRPADLSYQNSVTNNARDAAANWDYAVSSIYLQDEYRLSSAITTRIGLRGEFYQASQNISPNQQFFDRHGFYNTATVADKQALLPRLGISYKFSERLSFRGGFGLYSGGTPNVWLSNNYTNTGVNIDSVTSSNVENFDGRNIPEDLQNQLQAGNGNVDALDPDFQIPQTWKFSVGSFYRFDIPYITDNVLLDFDYTFSKVRYGLTWKDLRRNLASLPNNQPTTKGPDGRDLYDTDPTTSSENDFDPLRGYDLLLTNTEKGYGHTISVSLSKNFQTGWSLGGSYGWQNIFEVNPGTSSTSSSNYNNVAIEFDPNDPSLARSNYEREHRFVLTAGYTKNLISMLSTSFNLFFERRSGQPYSYTFGGNRDVVGGLFGEAREFASRNRMLFYVPKGDGSDVILDGIDEGEFNAFLKNSGLDKYRGRIAPRNAFTSSWMDRVDARFSQELPTHDPNKRARVILDIRNLPNLLNHRWGQVKQAPFPYFTRAVDVSYDAESGRYVYSNLNRNPAETVRLTDSIWRLQLGVVYDF